MPPPTSNRPEALILGEYRRLLDERYRVSIPAELINAWEGSQREAVLVKERPGCVSLWPAERWKAQMDPGIQVVQSKWLAGHLSSQSSELQTLGRLLSTRHREVHLGGRSRLLIPEGFREFLGASTGDEVLIIGAAICVEIWQVDAWLGCLRDEIPQFGSMLQRLIG